jgi:hypothetical protein
VWWYLYYRCHMKLDKTCDTKCKVTNCFSCNLMLEGKHNITFFLWVLTH